MEKFFSISSQQDTPQAVIEDCAQQCEAAPGEANFGFIYATDAMSADFSELLKRCKAATDITHWVGSLGLGVITAGQEIYDVPAASIMLANFPEDEFTMVPAISKEEGISVTTALATSVRHKFRCHPWRPVKPADTGPGRNITAADR